MATMYETILELPLFKGIGEEQLSLLLEKTPLEFLKFEEGEFVHGANQKVDALDFILSGKVRLSYTLKHYPISVEEICGKGHLLGAVNLFGMQTRYPSSALTLGKVSVMRVEKSQYMNILTSDRIFILNFVNYLSAAAQKAPSLLMMSGKPSIRRTLEELAFSLTARTAKEVSVIGKDEDLAAYCGVGVQEFREWKNRDIMGGHLLSDPRGIILLKK